MNKDLLVRSVAALVVLGCVVFFAFGVAAAVAADQRGTSIHDNEPVTFSLLWREVSQVSPEALVTWGSLSESWVQAILSVALTLALIAFTLAVAPRILRRWRHTAVIAGLGLVLGLLSVFGLWGLFYLLVTLFAAFAWGGLDGEWITELGPVYVVIGLLYLVVCLLFRRFLSIPDAGLRAR